MNSSMEVMCGAQALRGLGFEGSLDARDCAIGELADILLAIADFVVDTEEGLGKGLQETDVFRS